MLYLLPVEIILAEIGRVYGLNMRSLCDGAIQNTQTASEEMCLASPSSINFFEVL